jgi:four helix bundle protein
MNSDDEKTGAGPGARSASGQGSGSELPASASASAARGKGVFDHERLEVYGVAREFLEIATQLLHRKMSRDMRDQFDRATVSILSNIAEGAGKTARPDKQRFYEIARGSAMEAAAHLDIMKMPHHHRRRLQAGKDSAAARGGNVEPVVCEPARRMNRSPSRQFRAPALSRSRTRSRSRPRLLTGASVLAPLWIAPIHPGAPASSPR